MTIADGLPVALGLAGGMVIGSTLFLIGGLWMLEILRRLPAKPQE